MSLMCIFWVIPLHLFMCLALGLYFTELEFLSCDTPGVHGISHLR